MRSSSALLIAAAASSHAAFVAPPALFTGRSAAARAELRAAAAPVCKIDVAATPPSDVRVLVEERRPISYVIPILRDLTGIY